MSRFPAANPSTKILEPSMKRESLVVNTARLPRADIFRKLMSTPSVSRRDMVLLTVRFATETSLVNWRSQLMTWNVGKKKLR